MKYAYRLLVALIACGIAFSAMAAVTASLDRDHVAPGETVQLLLQSDDSPNGQPDLAPLQNDFSILGTSSGTRIQIINGHESSQTQLSFVLAPKHGGKLRIPPLQWGGQASPALELTVSSNPTSGGTGPTGQTATSESSTHVFLTATVDQQHPYVQSSVILTVRLYVDEPLYQAILSLPTSADVLVQQIGKDEQGSESRNGRSYHVIERKYLLSPQHSGAMTLQGPVLEATIPNNQNINPFGNDPFFANVFGNMQLPSIVTSTRPLHLQAKPIVLKVLPRPDGTASAIWLPAQNVSLTESWSPANASVHVGEPLTRHLSLSALGMTGEQLPDLNTLMQAPDDIKLYPDNSRVDDKPQGTTILGTREQDIALIASQPGHHRLPAVHLAWWDTTANVQREATLAAREFDVLPATGGASAVTTSTPSTAASPPTPNLLPTDAATKSTTLAALLTNASAWFWVSLGLGIMFLGTLLTWWKSRRRVPETVTNIVVNETVPRADSGGTPLKEFQLACRNNDPYAARKQLLAWAVTAWPNNPPRGLNALARRLDDDNLIEPLMHLDRACYTDGVWHGEDLIDAFPTNPVRPISAKYSRRALPDLYP